MVLVVGGLVLVHGAARAAETLSVCVDKMSASAQRDEKLAADVAKGEGAELKIAHFDSSLDDDGMSAHAFKKLLDKSCSLVMGYPVDQTDTSTLNGLLYTKPYAQTGFVLVEPAGAKAANLADLPNATEVSVTFETVPNLYFLRHPNLIPDVHTSDSDTLQALIDGKVKAALVWQATAQAYLETSPGKLDIHQLDEPHAHWNVVALYEPQAADAAAKFDAQIAAMHHAGAEPIATPDGFDPVMVRKAALDTPGAGGAPPAIYTEAQAKAGMAKFTDNCAVCHGGTLEGLSGPALKGPNFASEKANFSVGDVFTILSQNMPATNPGSLEHDDYVQIMSYVLQQNGYPAGATALTYDGATQSKVPLRYHGK